MKATGIVRRIDDLGRVVIPKEIRRTMRVREGDPLEIFMCEEGGVVFRKYQQTVVAEIETMREYVDDQLSYNEDEKRVEVRKHFNAILALLKEEDE